MCASNGYLRNHAPVYRYDRENVALLDYQSTPISSELATGELSPGSALNQRTCAVRRLPS